MRRKYDKPVPTSHGTTARSMEPSNLEDTLPPETHLKSSGNQLLKWLCLPYFSLERYDRRTSSYRPSSHPIRALLQAQYPGIQKEQDLQQAVTFLPTTPKDHCFHIAQLWCLILGDSEFIMTCINLFDGTTLTTIFQRFL